jgi:PII-like signaling protein
MCKPIEFNLDRASDKYVGVGVRHRLVADANNDLASGSTVLQGRDGVGSAGKRIHIGLRNGELSG